MVFSHLSAAITVSNPTRGHQPGPYARTVMLSCESTGFASMETYKVSNGVPINKFFLKWKTPEGLMHNN
jgi:hypothetical protein